jgi:hypothetical protein
MTSMARTRGDVIVGVDTHDDEHVGVTRQRWRTVTTAHAQRAPCTTVVDAPSSHT